MELIEERREIDAKLNAAVKLSKKRGKELARAESEYRIALAAKILQERDKGTPVTIVSDVSRGSPEIAKLRFERDCAEVLYKSAVEAINVYKLQIRCIEAQIEREWQS